MNPNSDYPTSVHTPTNVASNANSALGATSPTHTELEGKQEQEIVAIQEKLGTGASNASDAATGQVMTKKSDGSTGWQTPTSISDGDKGDVTISGSGTTFTIDNDVVTNAKAANMANSTIKGRATSGTGDPEDLTATQVRTILNVADGANNYSHPNHSGDVTSVGDGATTIANDAVTNAKLANMAANSIKGNNTGSSADPIDLTASQVRTLINVADGANNYSHPNHSGDVTSVGDGATTIANDAVTFAKMANIATDRLIGRDTASTGDPEAITVGGGIEFTGSGGIQTTAFTGDVTKTAGGTALTVANDAVTYAKMQNTSAASILLGRGSASGAGDLEEITLGTNLSMSGTTLNATGGAGVSDGDKGDITVSGSGATWTIDNSAVTNAKIDSVAWSKITSTPTTLAGYGITDDAEAAQDAVGTILVDSAEIDFTYNDTTPSITASIVASSIDESKLDASVNASLDLADTSVQPNSSPTFNAITATSSLTIDSSGTANLRVDRGATTNSALQVFTTAGTDRWSVGLRNDSTNDLHIRDAVNAVSIIKAVAGVTPSVNAGGNWTFTNDVTFPAAVVDIDDINATGTPSAANYLRGDGSWTSVTAAPAGSDTQIQFNDGGALGADAGLTYNKTTDDLSLLGELRMGNGSTTGDLIRMYYNGAGGNITLAAGETFAGEFGLVIPQFKVTGGRADFDALDDKAEIRIGGALTQLGFYNKNNLNFYFKVESDLDAFFYGVFTNSKGAVFNEDGLDSDFRIEGDTDANTFFVDAGVDRVGIGNNAPSDKLEVTGSIKLTGSSSRDLTVTRNSTSNTAGNDLTIQAGGATIGATDKSGGNLVLSSGISTGNQGSNIIFRTSDDATSGTSDNSPSEVGRITKDGEVLFTKTGDTTPFFQFSVANNGNALLGTTAYNNGIPGIVARHARGNFGSLTATQADDTLTQIGGRGYGTTGFVSGSKATLRFRAAENQTDTANGTYISFGTTANGTTTETERVRINNNGYVGIGQTAPNSVLHTNGAISTPISSKTSGYTITATDSIITADATSGAFNVTLPTAASITGRTYTIKRTNSGANTVTVNTTSSQTIDGSTTYSLSAQYKYVTVVSNGSNWHIVGNN